MNRKQNNGLHKCLKPETVETGVAYTFSFNPESQPIIQSFGKMTLTSFTTWSEEIYKMFDRCVYCIIETYMELSSAGRLHFHGTLKIVNIPKFYYFDLKILKFHGSFEIDTINTDNDQWDRYCLKQKPFMVPFCEEYGMPYLYHTRLRPVIKKAKEKVKIIDQ